MAFKRCSVGTKGPKVWQETIPHTITPPSPAWNVETRQDGSMLSCTLCQILTLSSECIKWPPQSPDLNPIEHLWDVEEREIHIMDVQLTNLQHLRYAIMSVWTKISEECFQNLVESMPRRIKAVLKAKGVQPSTSKVYLIKWPVSVCVCNVCMHIYIYIYIY